MEKGYISYEELLNQSRKFETKDFELSNGMKVKLKEVSGTELSELLETDSNVERMKRTLKAGLVTPKLLDLDDAGVMIDKNYQIANEISIEILTLSGVIKGDEKK